MPFPRRPRACNAVFGKSLKDFKGPPQLFRDLMMELKQWMSVNDLFVAINQSEKVCLMRQAWDMGKDPLVIMRSSPHALAGALKLWLQCLPEPLIRPDLARILVQATCCLEEPDRMHVMGQVLCHVEGTELQVLYPLLEFLHHHRLNAADPHALSDAFAPLLMWPERDGHFMDAARFAEACGLLTDALIQRYRTLFSGIVTAPRSELVPEVAASPAQQSAPRGAFGGREAVARLFGRSPTGELPAISEASTRSASSGDTDSSADSDMHRRMHDEAESAGMVVETPAAAEAAQRQSQDVSYDVESLLTESLDNMLFGEDDTLLQEAFMVPAQQSVEASMEDTWSERSASMDSLRSEDSCDSKPGACYEHLERGSPTSLLPDHPFSPPVLKDTTACQNHPYLHASMWMAPLPHEGTDHGHVIKGKSGAPLGGCHHEVAGHAGGRGQHSMMPSFGSWGAQVPVPMRM